jgi:hypothetical protein
MSTCLRCAYEGASGDFVAVGLDDNGNPFVTHRDMAGPFDLLVCRACAEDLQRASRSAMARAIVALMRRVMAGAS